jgi:TPR repeat protein
MNTLGVLYETGEGVGQDFAKAREWYEKAVLAGNNFAMNNLGWLYQTGKDAKSPRGGTSTLCNSCTTEDLPIPE